MCVCARVVEGGDVLSVDVDRFHCEISNDLLSVSPILLSCHSKLKKSFLYLLIDTLVFAHQL